MRVEFAAEEVGITTNGSDQSLVPNLVEPTAEALGNKNKNGTKTKNKMATAQS